MTIPPKIMVLRKLMENGHLLNLFPFAMAAEIKPLLFLMTIQSIFHLTEKVEREDWIFGTQ